MMAMFREAKSNPATKNERSPKTLFIYKGKVMREVNCLAASKHRIEQVCLALLITWNPGERALF